MSASAPPRAGMRYAFRALRTPAFRGWLLAHGLSFTGTWMARVAMGWLVYRLTGSELWLGLVTFASAIPALVLSPLAGVAADRYPLGRLVAVTSSLMALQNLTLGVLVLLGLLDVHGLLALALVMGVVSAFDVPARQAFILDLAGPEDLPSAIALGSAVVNVARVVGPAAAGFVVAAFGEGVAFVADGLTFLAPAAVAAFVRAPHARQTRRREGPWESMLGGMRYARRAVHVRTILPLVGFTALVGLPFLPMLPAFAADVLSGGPELLGWLNVAVGVGSITGALGVAGVVDPRRLPARLALGVALLGVGLIATGLSRWTWLTLAVLPLAGFGLSSQLAATNTLLQLASPDAMRGRVLALYTQVLLGVFPIGALLLGSVAEVVGVGPAVVGGGLAVVLVATRFAARREALAETVAPEARAA